MEFSDITSVLVFWTPILSPFLVLIGLLIFLIVLVRKNAKKIKSLPATSSKPNFRKSIISILIAVAVVATPFAYLYLSHKIQIHNLEQGISSLPVYPGAKLGNESDSYHGHNMTNDEKKIAYLNDMLGHYTAFTNYTVSGDVPIAGLKEWYLSHYNNEGWINQSQGVGDFDFKKADKEVTLYFFCTLKDGASIGIGKNPDCKSSGERYGGGQYWDIKVSYGPNKY